jgi:hypothetical protein
MMTPPEGGAFAAERVRSPAMDDPVRELLDDAVLAGGLCRGGATGAMHSTCGKYIGMHGGSAQARWR